MSLKNIMKFQNRKFLRGLIEIYRERERGLFLERERWDCPRRCLIGEQKEGERGSSSIVWSCILILLVLVLLLSLYFSKFNWGGGTHRLT